MTPAMAMRLANRCTRDSIAPLRRDILLDVARHPDARSREVSNRTVHPHTTVRRELEALRALGLLNGREEQATQGGREYVLTYYSVSSALDYKTLSTM
jgi:hypothetical protein